MPQTVACTHCRQSFLAQDYLLGQTVPCPSCGAPLIISAPPAPQSSPFWPAATSHLPASPHVRPEIGGQPKFPAWLAKTAESVRHWARWRQWTLAGIFIAVGLWIVLMLPLLILFALGMPAFNLPRIGFATLAVALGVLMACGGLLDWSFFLDSRHGRATQEWFGRIGARKFYVGIGAVFAAMGLLVAANSSFFAMSFAARHWKPRPRPSQAQVPLPPPGGDDGTHRLAGTWKTLPGGFRIRYPASATKHQSSIGESRRDEHSDFAGMTEDGVGFEIHALHHKGIANRPNRAQEILDAKAAGTYIFDPKQSLRTQDVVTVNGLLVVKETKFASVTFGQKLISAHVTEYIYHEGPVLIRVSVFSELDYDHPSYVSMLPYLDTLHRVRQ